MTITYKNDKTDYRKLYTYNALFGKKRKFVNLIIYAGICILSLVSMVVFLILSMPKPATLFLYASILFFALFGLSIVGVIVAVKKAMDNLNKTAVDFYCITTYYDFNDNGFTVTSKNTKKKKPTVTNLNYDVIIKGVELKSVIYLYVHPTVAFMLKKTDIDNLDELLTLFKKQLGDKFKCLQKI
jgi:hypothetical protein